MSVYVKGRRGGGDIPMCDQHALIDCHTHKFAVTVLSGENFIMLSGVCVCVAPCTKLSWNVPAGYRITSYQNASNLAMKAS